MSKALAFVFAHWNELLSGVMVLLSAVAAAGRAIPPARWAALEAHHPRVANAFRLCRAAGFDAVKAARAAWAILGPALLPLLRAFAAKRGVKLPPVHPRSSQE